MTILGRDVMTTVAAGLAAAAAGTPDSDTTTAQATTPVNAGKARTRIPPAEQPGRQREGRSPIRRMMNPQIVRSKNQPAGIAELCTA
jgi:hypothetical protein